ncbi:MAG TPA: DEAD/DEAH box helicase [Flavobacterium sp.]|nr:DEAD/DEAH box helicase [Flavobacterium sp.]
MNLKKINTNLQKALIENGLTEPSKVLKEAFGTIKSGNDVVIIADDATEREDIIVISVIQRLEKAFIESPRALIVVQDREEALRMQEKFESFGKHSDLRIFITHERTDLDEDKNLISLGIDVLIGTPERLNMMFSVAGYDVNQLKMYVISDLDELLRLRFDTRLARLSEGIGKTQRLYTSHQETERLELFVDKTMLDSYWFSSDEEEDFDEE